MIVKFLVKISNLNPELNDEDYNFSNENNLDISLKSNKRGAYAKFDDTFNAANLTNLEDGEADLSPESEHISLER